MEGGDYSSFIPITICTFNVHGCRGDLKQKRLANLIRSEGIDIIGMQEIDHDTASKLAGMLGYGFSFAFADYKGNALLTKFPLLDVRLFK
mmetsp:Transcript_34506/g.50413  ORF Transcript_34506/g.50413 Transcript_34506/m.50413 type:complete len:90 (+) Transcript_34506:46-315(+)